MAERGELNALGHDGRRHVAEADQTAALGNIEQPALADDDEILVVDGETDALALSGLGDGLSEDGAGDTGENEKRTNVANPVRSDRIHAVKIGMHRINAVNTSSVGSIHVVKVGANRMNAVTTNGVAG